MEALAGRYDSVVDAHGRALLEEKDSTRFVAGDIFEPKSMIEDDTVREHLD
ncbi:hypothetical protein Q5425_35670 [Amycolatopsis sp. A133]|uniref:hypothetical protein n=1 Tax=Amycolatopsis sp. A133 TaxID=3064472 RepID=UPI0027F9A2EF|nr:hypothetical protein [Amycolatopsis sp. A133]MDQ7809095.1 hypothetical protein [Amycolatopsis sp. A133]